MQTIFEKMGGTYRQEGDYLLPNIEVPESPRIGIWGERRRKYLREQQKALYATMILSDALNTHLEEVDHAAEKMFDQLTVQMKSQEGVTEELKASNQLEWVQRMNNIHNRASEIVCKELIYI